MRIWREWPLQGTTIAAVARYEETPNCRGTAVSSHVVTWERCGCSKSVLRLVTLRLAMMTLFYSLCVSGAPTCSHALENQALALVACCLYLHSSITDLSRLKDEAEDAKYDGD